MLWAICKLNLKQTELGKAEIHQESRAEISGSQENPTSTQLQGFQQEGQSWEHEANFYNWPKIVQNCVKILNKIHLLTADHYGFPSDFTNWVTKLKKIGFPLVSYCCVPHFEAKDPFLRECPKSLTERSLSAVGLFFGFFVSAILTKLWNVADLKEKEGLCWIFPGIIDFNSVVKQITREYCAGVSPQVWIITFPS